MNYIKHLSGFFEKVSTDFDLNPTHISLYMSIFQLWNQNRFQNPIGISRDELMRISKIASNATYHKCMKELAEKNYVNYNPSYNPFKGSTLEVINLDFYTKPIQKKEIKKLKNQQKNEQVVEQVNEHDDEQALNKHCTSTEHVPYINNINSINVVNRQAEKNEDENSISEGKNELLENSFVTPSAVERSKKKLREKKGSEIPPDHAAVLEFFKENKASAIEAEKFYNYFQSNGWLVGGKSKMKDWKAAARNWMLNSEKFSNKTRHPELVEGPKPNHLHIPNHKNYSEPL
jgi:SOS-response transcriptional repressor LexA